MQPIISVIIPVYNVEKYIKLCLDSIIKQKVKEDLEVICINDGSTDKSGIICDEYARKDKRFKVIHQKNQGVSVARNTGLKFAKGKYIGWIDPDDYIADNWYEQISIFMKKDIDFIFFDHIRLIGNKVKKIKYKNDSGYIEKEKFLKELVLDKKIQSQLCLKVMKKELFYNIKLNLEYKMAEDFAIMHFLVEKAKTIYYISDYLYFYLMRQNSLTHDIELEDIYKFYLISKERYIYLVKKNIKVSRIDYFRKAFKVCSKFYQLKNFTEKEKNQFDICKKELKDNIKYILLSKDATIDFKLKVVVCWLNILKILLRTRNIWKSKA